MLFRFQLYWHACRRSGEESMAGETGSLMNVAEGSMETKARLFRTIALSLVLVFGLSCNLMRSMEGTPIASSAPTEPSLLETEVALRVLGTSLANEQLTLQAAQAQMTSQVIPTLQATQTSPPPATAPDIPPTPVPSQTAVPASQSLVLEIRTSVSTFYCYQPPYELTITVRVSDINRGMAVYYHIQDKNSGVTSDWQSLDLRRKTSDTRSATIIGGGSMDQNLQFPPLMGESYFIYQIISDDGAYRSTSYGDVTFFPCGQ
jgi:hypothetical protein